MASMASRTLKTFSMRFGKSMHFLIRSHPASIHINFTDFKRTISLLRTKPRQLELRGTTVTHFLRRSFAASSDTSPTQTDPALKLSESCVKKVFYSNFYLKSKINKKTYNSLRSLPRSARTKPIYVSRWTVADAPVFSINSNWYRN